jgi:hypothetical protein
MKLLLILTFFFFTHFGYSQTIHWLVDKDSITDCDFIKSGKFVNKVTDCQVTEGYYIVYKDGFVTEYMDYEKFYVKSKINFISECEYNLTIVEVSKPDYFLKIGDVVNAVILETKIKDNLIKIKLSIKGQGGNFVLEKIEE